MGMYTEATISINVRAVERTAKAYGLPKPRRVQDWMDELNLAEVKQYCDRARELRYAIHKERMVADAAALELLDVAAVLETQALHYRYQGEVLASGHCMNRVESLKLLRKRSRAFRVSFA